MKTILPLLFAFISFTINAQQSCNQIIPPAFGNTTGGVYHVHHDSTITNGDGLIFYICSGVHLTVNASAGNIYMMENNSQLTINDHNGDGVFAKGNCTIIDNTIENIIVNKEASSTFFKPNMPSAALVFTCSAMVYDYSMVGGSSPCGQINNINEIDSEQLKIYPNPVNRGESIFFNNEIQSLRLFNINGELVFEALNINTNNMQLPKLKAGLYIARMSSLTGKEEQLKINIQ